MHDFAQFGPSLIGSLYMFHDTDFFYKDSGELLNEVLLSHLGSVDLGLSRLSCMVDLLWLKLDLAADQRVVCVAVCAVICACGENTFQEFPSCDDNIKLMPLFGARMRPGYFMLGFSFEEGICYAEVLRSA